MAIRLFSLLTLSALAALAAEEGGHGGGDPLISYKWINFGILVALLLFAVVKYLIPMLNERSAEIQKDLAESRANVAQAEARIKDLEAKLGNFEGELASIRARVAQEREAEAKRISEQTANLLEKLSQQMRNEITNETKVAEQQLRAFTARKALELAEARLAGQQDAASQQNLVASFVNDLKQVGSR